MTYEICITWIKPLSNYGEHKSRGDILMIFLEYVKVCFGLRITLLGRLEAEGLCQFMLAGLGFKRATRIFIPAYLLTTDSTYYMQADHTIHTNTTPPVTQGAGASEGFRLGGAGAGAPLFPGLGLGGLGMIMSNPRMCDIIDQNPEFAHVLNDPVILRQTPEAARNPELMREMMMNTDRAMSNIESSPEGFNMLRRMYANVQELFLNATRTGGGDGNDAGSNPFAALLGNCCSNFFSNRH
ncbi:ubiquitin domain-containing protein DSK2a [Artemisia annua]|uniref:Ubiquitin domain-containing protein DSK2a n=1 Tax=Artemisia annua TaxID=35608 RepID=A0A2U1KZL3_ARTAN|nr:ubiquitin domain-containing protein DSK2a [Artemisia annua]